MRRQHRRTDHVEPPAPERRVAVVVVRQSEFRAIKDHAGSGDAQLRHREHLIARGWAPEDIEVVDLRGEAAGPDAARSGWEALLERMQRGEIGAAAWGVHDRIARSAYEGMRMLYIARRHSVELVIEGQAVDPGNKNDRLLVGMRTLIADLDRELLIERTATASNELARDRRLRKHLAGLLCWVRLDDVRYRTAMESQGLGEWLERSRHSVCRSGEST